VVLIAEIGNCHLGNKKTFKDMIRIAKECGATMVKSQAFLAKDINGSFPPEFYKMCQFTYEEYLEMIWWAKEIIGIDIFYSIFSKKLDPMKYNQRWHKYADSQVKSKLREIEKNDAMNLIVSVPEISVKPKLEHAYVMHVSNYLTNAPALENIRLLKEYYDRPVGYSDHTVGIDWCEIAYKEYGACIIEKHFTLTRNIYYDNKQYRDAIHSATPDELCVLAKRVGL
jgi:N,N'-diacetyllegionaminate synthase